jgi:hypothetical protein
MELRLYDQEKPLYFRRRSTQLAGNELERLPLLN